MSSIFCCPSPSPYRPAVLLHEDMFMPFIAWAKLSQSAPVANSASLFQDPEELPRFVVQFVQQVNYGPVEAKRYFVPSPEASSSATFEKEIEFLEVTEQDLIAGNFQKLNAYVWLTLRIFNTEDAHQVYVQVQKLQMQQAQQVF